MAYTGSSDENRLPGPPDRGFMGFFIGAVVGLIIGATGGALCMYVATRSAMPVAVDAVARGMAIDEMQKARAANAAPQPEPPTEPPAPAP